MKSRADVQEDQLKAGMKPNDPQYGVEPDTEQGLLHTEVEGKVIRENIQTLPGDYKEYYEAVYQSLTSDLPEPVTAQDGVNVMRVIDAAFESAEQGKVIDLG